MAGALNILKAPTLTPTKFSHRARPNNIHRKFSAVRSSSTSSEEKEDSPSSPSSSPSTASFTISAPANFKAPEPKTLGVRPDKRGDILGASLAIFFRLGTGVFASGYYYYYIKFVFYFVFVFLIFIRIFILVCVIELLVVVEVFKVLIVRCVVEQTEFKAGENIESDFCFIETKKKCMIMSFFL